jgi:hypothetical protein
MMIRGLSEHNRGLLVRSATVQVPEPYGPKSQAPPVPTSGYKWRGANVAREQRKKMVFDGRQRVAEALRF